MRRRRCKVSTRSRSAGYAPPPAGSLLSGIAPLFLERVFKLVPSRFSCTGVSVTFTWRAFPTPTPTKFPSGLGEQVVRSMLIAVRVRDLIALRAGWCLCARRRDKPPPKSPRAWLRSGAHCVNARPPDERTASNFFGASPLAVAGLQKREVQQSSFARTRTHGWGRAVGRVWITK